MGCMSEQMVREGDLALGCVKFGWCECFAEFLATGTAPSALTCEKARMIEMAKGKPRPKPKPPKPRPGY